MEMNIKDLRIQVGMTQVKFAEYFGIKLRTLQDWEYERSKPSDALTDLMVYKLRNEGLLVEGEVGEEHIKVPTVSGESSEFREKLQKHLWRSELVFRAKELPKGSCVDWLAPYCNTIKEIVWLLRDLGFRIERIVDEEDCAGEIYRWVETAGGVFVYANLPGSDLNGFVGGRWTDL